MSTQDEILQFVLPTRLSRWTAGLSIPLGMSATLLPEFLRLLQVPIPSQLELPVRIAAIASTWFLAILLVLIFVLRHYRSFVAPLASKEIVLDAGNPLLSILALIAKHHSQNIQATPKLIATDLGLDPEITLAYMWKYHNEQYFTYANGSKKPELDTPFFLSPKAWQYIKVVQA